jgi:hypothetical protein
MVVSGAITQPISQSTLHMIETVLGNGPLSHMDVAAAYVTTGGAQDLVFTMQKDWPQPGQSSANAGLFRLITVDPNRSRCKCLSAFRTQASEFTTLIV